ncbi:polymorphic toxin-type HINT domain-containing protein [Streptomyces shenzhenensis]|uniref:polymorphic toxin-type HINT domain-containing protein n=1 Tax=Streptomyces shenzhenensis TaxID=943815 RepID=UPI00368D8770
MKHLVEVAIDIEGKKNANAKKGTKTAEVTATAGHPFWVSELGEWIEATGLNAGQRLRTGSGIPVQIMALRRWTALEATVHNLTVSRVHTYYVLAGAAPVRFTMQRGRPHS